MKKRVNSQVLNDMRRYVKGINIDDYESSGYPTDPAVIELLRKYYASHLPVDVDAWRRANVPDHDNFYAKGLNEQVKFVSEEICSLFFPDFEEWEKNKPMVIGTHVSQGVLLPIYQIKCEGVEITFKYNFYDWTISVNSEKDLDIDFMGVINVDETITAKKFPKEKIYGSYSQSKSQFTVRICSSYKTYAFFLLLSNCLGIKKA